MCPANGFQTLLPALHQPVGLGIVLPRTQCSGHWQSVRCKNQRPPQYMEDAHAPAHGVSRSHSRTHPCRRRPDRLGRFLLRLGQLHCRLPFQSRLQHRRQLFATHGSPPQNIQTRLRTQIILLVHSVLQNLRQGRCVFFVGERPTPAHQELDTRRSIRLPDSNQRRASLFDQAQAPRRTVPQRR